ncbi:MAG: nitroreductase family deazaflavin-dependent oxidoreductase [Deltaproteobacteria bacterium]|nr:nitroreductase family deazaflavin-dependent oxidoreductase [Deltaproteobacteria bacterium]MBW2359395.1 nitroreductase family deazaflavin-dependent oxidoreductase [Deltaproteobacteria bacterium]
MSDYNSPWVVRFASSAFGAELDRVLVRWIGHSLVNLLFSRATHVEYNPPLLLTSTGARTGQPRRAVLPYFPAGEHIAIVGSRGGMPSDPNWAHNLRAHPEATIHVNRRARRVRAQLATGEERAALWQSIAEQAPVYLTYEKRAAGHREIPVFVLKTIGAD